jgi:thiamine pyrophosphokinase
MGILDGPISKRFFTTPGARWSLISISDQCEEVTLEGMKFLLNSEALDYRHPRGVSNQAEKEEVWIRFSSGSMVYIHWRSQDQKENHQ